MLKHFDQSQDVANNGQEMFNYYNFTRSAHTISMSLRLRRDFVIRKLDRKKGINIHAALQRFRKI